MAALFPNPPLLPSPQSIPDPETRAWAQSLTNSLQVYLGQVGQILGQLNKGPIVVTPNNLHTWQLGVNNSGVVTPTQIS